MEEQELRSELKDLINKAIEQESEPVETPAPEEQNRRPLPLYIIGLVVSVAVLIAAAAVYSRLSDRTDPDAPWGQITAPPAGTAVPRDFSIAGETLRIPDGHRILLAVDVEDLRLCWPKKPWISANAHFRTRIHEGGPAETFAVSLYSLDEKYIDQVNAWFQSGVLGGMPIIPKRYLLDTVKLKLQRP